MRAVSEGSGGAAVSRRFENLSLLSGYSQSRISKYGLGITKQTNKHPAYDSRLLSVFGQMPSAISRRRVGAFVFLQVITKASATSCPPLGGHE